MFKFTTATKAQVKFKVGTASHEFGMEFRWLTETDRAAILESHDAAVKPEEGKKIGVQEINQAHADAIMALANGWDLQDRDGQAVAWDAPTIAQVLDYIPGLFFVILDAARAATSAQAIRGN